MTAAAGSTLAVQYCGGNESVRFTLSGELAMLLTVILNEAARPGRHDRSLASVLMDSPYRLTKMLVDTLLLELFCSYCTGDAAIPTMWEPGRPVVFQLNLSFCSVPP
jgi:hypothetical protein